MVRDRGCTLLVSKQQQSHSLEPKWLSQQAHPAGPFGLQGSVALGLKSISSLSTLTIHTSYTWHGGSGQVGSEGISVCV